MLRFPIPSLPLALLCLALAPACLETKILPDATTVLPGDDASNPPEGDAGNVQRDAGQPQPVDGGQPAKTDGGNNTDQTAPTVASTTPKDGDLDVPLDRKISITFSEPVDLDTLSAADFELIEWWDGNPQGEALPGTLDTTGNPTILFVPAANFTVGDEFKFTVKAGIHDLAGNALAADYSFIFDAAWVEPSQAPQVKTVLPAAAATVVPTNSAVVVTFNRKMAQSTITAGTSVTLSAGGSSVAMQRDASGDPSFIFTPQAALTANTTYTLVVKGGATGVKDEVGNTMADDFTSTFTTGTGPDTEPLQVVSVTPADAATDVSQVTTVAVTFNKPVQPSKLFLSYPGTTGTFRVSKYADLAFPEKGTLDLAANPTVTFTLDPATTLELERTYHLRVTGGASGVKAVSGATMAADFNASFTTKAPDNADGTLADLRAASGVCAIRVKGVTMTFFRDQPNNWKGFFVQKEQSGPAIFVVTGNTKPLFPIYPDPSASGYPTIDLTATKVIESNGFKEVTAFSMTRGATTLDLKTVRETLVQVIGDEVLGADRESEYVQVDGTLANYKPGSSAENREFDLTYGTSRKVKLKISQFGIMEPMALSNGSKVRVTAPLQKDANGYFLKPYVFTTETAMTKADLDLPANYDYALDIVKLAD
ncbi:MAG: Ig-like domain-containing protein [Myxococcales bacterium]